MNVRNVVGFASAGCDRKKGGKRSTLNRMLPLASWIAKREITKPCHVTSIPVPCFDPFSWRYQFSESASLTVTFRRRLSHTVLCAKILLRTP
jgi:hypothetical protein